MKKLYKVKLSYLLVVLFGFFYSDILADYASKSNQTGNYESPGVWSSQGNLKGAPPTNGIVSQALTIETGSVITRNGDFSPVAVSVKGTFVVTGTYVNNLWGGVTIEKDGILEIYGDLTASKSITVKPGGTLIVHGNLSSTDAGITSHGDIIVVGDFSTASSTTIQNNGNLIVGGNFTHLGGGLNVNGNTDDTKIYILNPDAVVSAPGWSVIHDPEMVGDLEDFFEDEGGSQLGDIVNEVYVSVVIGFQWKKNNTNSSWGTNTNWTGNKAPSSNDNARIKAPEEGNLHPVITFSDGLIVVNNLTIEPGAVLTLKPGAKLTVNGVLTIEEEGGLVMENTTEINGLSSLITNGEIVGKARINLVFPRDEWYYVSQPIKEAKSNIYELTNPDGTFRSSEAWVNIHRANRWYRIGSGVALAELEGVSVKYRVADVNDEADHLVSYTGELNNDPISRTFANKQYYLFGNPYPSAVNWQDSTGWTRNNIGETIYYRARVNGVMTFVTYNRFIDEEAARATVFPDGVAYGNVIELANILPLQSVWVSSLGDGSITIDNTARQHVAAGSLLKSSRKTGNSKVIRIGSSNESGADGTVLYFSENSTEGLDRGDSEKMFNDAEGIPEVFTRVGERAMAINGLPVLTSESYSIPLSVRNKIAGDVTLKFDLKAFAGDYVPWLEDLYSGTSINLRETNTYKYAVVDVGTNHDRFVIHLKYVAVVESEDDDSLENDLEIEESEIGADGSNEEITDSVDNSEVVNEDADVDSTDNTIAESTVDDNSGEAIENDSEEPSDNAIDNSSEDAVEDVTEDSPEVSDDASDNTSDSSDEQVVNDNANVVTNDGSEEVDDVESPTEEEPVHKVSTSLRDQQQEASDAQNAISIKSISGKVLVSVDVEMLQGGQGIVEIYTIEGRKISEVPARSSRTLVFLPTQSGIYIVRAIFGNNVKSERVMVKGQ